MLLQFGGHATPQQPLSYAERLAADIPGAELVVIDDGGHFLLEDQLARVRRETLAFL